MAFPRYSNKRTSVSHLDESLVLWIPSRTLLWPPLLLDQCTLDTFHWRSRFWNKTVSLGNARSFRVLFLSSCQSINIFSSCSAVQHPLFRLFSTTYFPFCRRRQTPPLPHFSSASSHFLLLREMSTRATPPTKSRPNACTASKLKPLFSSPIWHLYALRIPER